MKMSWQLGFKLDTKRIRKRVERAKKHNDRKARGYYSHHEECPYCGGRRTWCDSCRVWSSNCCVPYGTCLCS